jgi:hypothetical protein
MTKSSLIDRAEQLIENNHGILYRSSMSILKTGIKRAKNLLDYSDLQEFVPLFEKEYTRLKSERETENREKEKRKMRDINILFKSYTKEMLFKQLENCQKESMKLKQKWDLLRRDERTQRKATISNRLDANAKEMMLIQDALAYLKEEGLVRIE